MWGDTVLSNPQMNAVKKNLDIHGNSLYMIVYIFDTGIYGG